jgi:hypothetical protein
MLFGRLQSLPRVSLGRALTLPRGTVGLRRKPKTPPLGAFCSARFAVESHLLDGARAVRPRGWRQLSREGECGPLGLRGVGFFDIPHTRKPHALSFAEPHPSPLSRCPPAVSSTPSALLAQRKKTGAAQRLEGRAGGVAGGRYRLASAPADSVWIDRQSASFLSTRIRCFDRYLRPF